MWVVEQLSLGLLNDHFGRSLVMLGFLFNIGLHDGPAVSRGYALRVITTLVTGVGNALSTASLDRAGEA